MTSPDAILAPILEYALENGVIEAHQAEAFSARLMDTVSLRPSELQKIFEAKKAEDPVAAYRRCINEFVKGE